jgi:hypothetical protein
LASFFVSGRFAIEEKRALLVPAIIVEMNIAIERAMVKEK